MIQEVPFDEKVLRDTIEKAEKVGLPRGPLSSFDKAKGGNLLPFFGKVVGRRKYCLLGI